MNGKLLLLILFAFLFPLISSACGERPTYSGYYLSTDSPSNGFEFILTKGEVLHGKVIVDQGDMVFYVRDYWNYSIKDAGTINAGESYSFSIKAKQSGEKYYCFFLPHGWGVGRFYINMSATGLYFKSPSSMPPPPPSINPVYIWATISLVALFVILLTILIVRFSKGY